MNPGGEYGMQSLLSEKERYLAEKEAACAQYRQQSPNPGQWLAKRDYYYQRKIKLLRHLLPSPGRVLEIGCGLGQNLAGLAPEYGVGIDLCPSLIEEARTRYPASAYPHLDFRVMSAMQCGDLNEKFDTILLVNSITEIPDLLKLFSEIRKLCKPETRVVQVTYNYLLAPVVKLSGALGLAPKHPVQNWLTRYDFLNVFTLAGFDQVREGYDMVMPFRVPLLSDWVNRYTPAIPFMKPFCMLYYSVARPMHLEMPIANPTVTVCVPCKNEEGNVPGLAERIPEMGGGTEIIFVDDRSTDGTAAAVDQAIQRYPDRNIRMVKGPGVNKGAACRAGFAEARNDILMILDADMTVMPEDLPAFYDAIVSGKGEFINGSRLVYPLEGGAMKFANILGNKAFALLFSYVLSQRLKDTLCGTKVIWRNDYEKILESRRHFGEVDKWGDYDWIFGAARHNLKIIELPVHYRERVFGETKMTKRFKNAWTMLKMCYAAFTRLKLL